MSDPRELLAEYALGMLPADDAARVEELLATDASARAELRELEDAAAALVEPVAPPPALRARVLESTKRGRFHGFAEVFGELFDVTVERAKQLLDLVDDPREWGESPGPGGLIHFTAGPAVAGADTGFVRVPAGAEFPEHGHGGEEITLVLQGGAVDSDGVEFKRGAVIRKAGGTRHSFTALPGVDYIFAVIVEDVQFE